MVSPIIGQIPPQIYWMYCGDSSHRRSTKGTVRHRTLRTVCTLASLLPQKSAESDHDDITMDWKGDRLNLVPSHLPPGSGSLCRASSHSLPRLRAGSMEYLKPVPNEETFKRMMFFKHVVDHVAHVHDIAPFICCSCF